MQGLMAVSRRSLRPELMDQPELEDDRLFGALRGLERINFFSGSSGILWHALRRLAAQHGRKNFSILDVACGAGDLTIALWQRARRDGWTGEVAGCDINPRSVEYATKRAKQCGADVQFRQIDAIRDPLPEFDVVLCSLFLHHLTEAGAVVLLEKMRTAARHLVLINDLARSKRGYVLAVVGTRLLSRCDVVHEDGPQSVKAAFTPDEALALAETAELHGARVEERWPCRFLLSWERA